MSKINFYLKGAKAQKELELLKISSKKEYEVYLQKPLPLLLYCSIGGARLKFAMNASIAPKHWDLKSQRVKKLADTPKSSLAFNKKMEDAIELLNIHIDGFQKRGKKVSKESISLALRGTPEKVVALLWTESIEDTYTHFLANHKNPAGFTMELSTIKKHKTIKKNLTDFVTKYYPCFEWLDIDINFLRKFQDYIYDELDNIDNTATKYIKGVKTVLRYLQATSYPINPTVLNFKVREYEAPALVVELKELQVLMNKEIVETGLAMVRDVFIFMAWTGQRFSDIKTIDRKAITKRNGQNVWLVTTEKTNDTSITVPLNEYCMEILERYANYDTAIPIFSEPYFNRSIKDVFRKAEINRVVRKIIWKRGRPLQTSEPISEIITSHVARKTFITNSLILGMSESEVKKISGHKDDRSFRRYVELGSSYLSKAKVKLSKNKVEEMIALLAE
jgi:integrase